MITFFTTTKPFIGQNRLNQLNALKSWKQCPHCEIVIFDQIIGADEAIDGLEIINIIDVEKFSSEEPLPLVSDMFNKVKAIAKNKICCYLNSDIILPTDFVETITKIDKKLKANYLLVGNRLDIDVNSEILFEKNWEAEFIKQNEMKIHPPLGSDFFIFPKNQYANDEIPPLVIGRPGWDNWFIYNSVKVKKIKVVDISNSVLVYHQNHNATYHNKQSLDKSTQNNLSFLLENVEYNYVLNQTNYFTFNSWIIKRKNGPYIFRLMKKIRNRAMKALSKPHKANSI